MNVLKKLFPVDEFKKTIRRFPGSALCSFALFILIILNIHDVIDLDERFFSRILVILSYGFFWFGLARLLTEGKNWTDKKERILGYAGIAVLSGFVFFGSGFTLAWLLGLMIPALLLGISIGPYVESRDNLSFWFYNRQVWQGAAISILAGLIWGGGISAALAAIHHLFGLKIDGEVYADVWTFALCVFTPIYALSWVPQKYSYTVEDCHAPPQLSFMINWVLAPLVVVYMLILYAYFIKIGIEGALPKGQLSYMVTAFGGVGVLTYLAGWPLRYEGGPFLKPIYKVFFPALILPVVMQALSIYLRVDQYGVTEQRYLIIVSTVWMGILAGWYSVKKPPLKYIPMILALMLVVAALGPLSAPNIAERSQMGRLETLLVDNGILRDGKIGKAESSVSFEDRKSISSILDFLRDRKKLERIHGWLEPSDFEERRHKRQEEKFVNIHTLTKKMGFEYVSSYQRKQDQRSENVNLNAPYNNKVSDVRGFDVFIHPQRVSVAWYNKNKDAPVPRWVFKDQNEQGVVAYYQDGRLYVGMDGKGEIGFDVKAFADQEYKRDPSDLKREMVLEKREGNLRVKLMLTNINLRRTVEEGQEDAPYELNSFSFKALIDY